MAPSCCALGKLSGFRPVLVSLLFVGRYTISCLVYPARVCTAPGVSQIAALDRVVQGSLHVLTSGALPLQEHGAEVEATVSEVSLARSGEVVGGFLVVGRVTVESVLPHQSRIVAAAHRAALACGVVHLQCLPEVLVYPWVGEQSTKDERLVLWYSPSPLLER